MTDIPWKIFSQTGNIEAYLLMKEMEDTEEQLYQDHMDGQELFEDHRL
ncbi:hypothetical protein GGQ92_000585 [Gracilibacillus halotolerans]|uniref:YqzL-like protein n=1 Tax=Gracilibacillus halotolerans TaxID=74386 RepID=A0A841RM79_9BACI|nr:hypothetical protein [Gracilibacillus halotolerans]